MHAHIRRWRFLLFVSLIFGLFSTAGLVVGSVLWVDLIHARTGFGEPRHIGDWLIWVEDRGFGGVRYRADWMESPYTQETIELFELILEPEPDSVLPGSIARALRVGPIDGTGIRRLVARGWPFLATWFEYRSLWPEPIQDWVMGGISLEWEAREHHGRSGGSGQMRIPRAIPIRPIWSGLIANTLIFSSIPFLGYLGFRSFRRWRRRSRGRCPDCAYVLRGAFDAGCPECGWNRPKGEALDAAPDSDANASTADSSSPSPSSPLTSAAAQSAEGTDSDRPE